MGRDFGRHGLVRFGDEDLAIRDHVHAYHCKGTELYVMSPHHITNLYNAIANLLAKGICGSVL